MSSGFKDARATAQRDTNTLFSMTHFDSLEDWQSYAEVLRRRILVSSALWPLPERTPLHAKVFGTIKHEDYSVSKVYFEAYPGFLVTGNLYVPVGKGPFPAIACPHGHWAKGRFEDSEKASVPARCITFARMGIVAFSYDMIGYNDSEQFPKAWGHQWDSIPDVQRKAQELWGIHPFGLQLWSSIRTIDFLQGLPEVDPERIGCTGASGGGTQTFTLCAVDPRIKVAAPVNMISHRMQGGCACENAPLIRINASNMEIGALFAPKPLLMVSATGDWTVDTPKVEFPAVQSIYRLYGAADHVSMVQFDYHHNYNKTSREAVYRHFGKYLLKEPDKYRDFKEPPYKMDPVEALRVFPGDGPPAGYPDEATLISQLKKSIHAKWLKQVPKTYTDALPFWQKNAGALGDVLGMDIRTPLKAKAKEVEKIKIDDYTVHKYVLEVPTTGAAIPAVVLMPQAAEKKAPVLIVDSQGKANLATGPGGALAQALLADGHPVASIDAFLTGEMAGKRMEGKYPDTFVPSTTAYRVQDVIAAARWLSTRGDSTVSVDVVGLNDAGVWCVFAAALEHHIAHTIADFNGFNPNDDDQWVQRQYIPCVRSIGDVLTAAYFIAPRGLWIMNAAKDYDTSPLDKAFFDSGSKAFRSTEGAASTQTIVAALH